MQEDIAKRSLKRTVIKAALIFITSYILFLMIWIGIKDVYGKMVTRIASSLITVVKEVTIEGIEEKGDILMVTFVPQRYKARRSEEHTSELQSH